GPAHGVRPRRQLTVVRHRTLRTLLAAALLVVSAVACGDDDDSAGSTTTTTAGETTTADTTTTTEPTTTTEAASTSTPYEITVEDPGQEPRRPLRLAVGAGDTDQVTLRQEMAIEAAAGGQVQSVPSPINE